MRLLVLGTCFVFLTIAFQNCELTSSGFAVRPASESQNEVPPPANEPPAESSPLFKGLGPYTVASVRDVPIADVPVLTADAPDKTLRLNLWYPEGVTENLPVIVYIHGGGWRTGSYTNCMNFVLDGVTTNLCQHMASRGYAVASITYRLSDEAKFPAQIHDVKTAIRFLRKNASSLAAGQVKLDKERISVLGTSAGGHLALLLGTSTGVAELEGSLIPGEDSSVKGVVSFFGPTDFSKMNEQLAETFDTFMDHNSADSGECKLIGCTGPMSDHLDLVAAANPLTYVNGDEPPILARHGRADSIVPFQQSEMLRDSVLNKGGYIDFQALDGVEHNFHQVIGTNPLARQAYQDAVIFFDKNLKEIEP